MKLVSVYRCKDAPRVLWSMMKARLAEKQPVNISHRKMPTWKQHLAFIRSRANGDWYLIDCMGGWAGWVYLNTRGEIGLMIFPNARGFGIGGWALKAIMKRHPRKNYLANINPKNKRSIKFFERLGFKIVQQTYELRK